jgi:hypothetical protein
MAHRIFSGESPFSRISLGAAGLAVKRCNFERNPRRMNLQRINKFFWVEHGAKNTSKQVRNLQSSIDTCSRAQTFTFSLAL